MTSKVLFFSIDRLGDYLIRSNVIKEISKHYTSTEIVTSDINFKLINSQTFFDKTVKFDKNKNSKFEFLKKYFLKEYDAVISFDGKRISKLIYFLLNQNLNINLHINLFMKKKVF